jgi:hypothetical protein
MSLLLAWLEFRGGILINLTPSHRGGRGRYNTMKKRNLIIRPRKMFHNSFGLSGADFLVSVRRITLINTTALLLNT